MNVDLLVIGGGINGVGIAVDAAGRGLSVALCEKGDLANATSWKSSKLIHGGLRYLEYYDFNLVRKALREREILLRKAPHLIRPLEFIMPYVKQIRPAWLIRLGLFLYDHLSRRQILPGSKRLNLRKEASGAPLKKTFKTGFSYYDCYGDDSRLVVMNAMQAKELGAEIFTHTEFIAAERNQTDWKVLLHDKIKQENFYITAKALVNASGPWADQVVAREANVKTMHHIILIKGSHIVVPKIYPENHAFILQNDDKRIVFVIPFAEKYSLIGTTDVSYQGDLDDVEISPTEINYLLASVNSYFDQAVKAEDIVWSYAGVRPLQQQDDANNPSAITRDFTLELNDKNNFAPALNIFGGKLTTYRELSEEAVNLLKPFFPTMGPAWTAHKPLPGGNIPKADFKKFLASKLQQYAWVPPDLLKHYAKNYGTLIDVLLEHANKLEDLGQHFGAGLYQREVEYLIKYEWARSVDDILWRRTKFGIEFPEKGKLELNEFLKKM